jgi:hypothetical protein
MITVYRKNRELTGKELSANTIASFLVAQSLDTVPDLSAGREMSGSLLLFLNRERAIGYWIRNGWLCRSEANLSLTEAGIDEVQSREAGVAMGSSNKKKPGNVNPQRVREARQYILTGQVDEDIEVLNQQFDLSE